MSIAIHTLKLGTMDNFIHIIAETDSGEAMIVDPAWEPETLLQFIDKHGYTLTGLLLTHSHSDHISAFANIVKKSDVPIYITKTEFRLGLARIKNPYHIKDGDTISLGNTVINVIATPGHTVGSVCYYADKHLVVGDTLFIDGCGRCNFYESDVNKMWDSLQRLKQLPDNTLIYCGHDYGQKPLDTLGNQKHTNPYLLIEDKAFFIDFRMHLQAQYRSIPFSPSSREEMTKIYQKHQSAALNTPTP